MKGWESIFVSLVTLTMNLVQIKCMGSRSNQSFTDSYIVNKWRNECSRITGKSHVHVVIVQELLYQPLKEKLVAFNLAIDILEHSILYDIARSI